MNRLWVRLTLAFIIVTQLSILVTILLIRSNVTSDFRHYVVHREQNVYGKLSSRLMDYYDQAGSWAGVGPVVANAGPDVLGNAVHPGDAWSQPILANVDWQIVYDPEGKRLGDTLTSMEQTLAYPIGANGPDDKPVGYLLPDSYDVLDPVHGPEKDFLNHLSSTTQLAGLVVGALGIIAGLVITQALVTPLANLVQTARAFAAHQWDRRAKVHGAREIAAVALAFNEMADEIQLAEAQRRNMIADIAHELRTPLTVMQGNLRAMLDQVYPLELSEIAVLYDETRVLGRLVDDLRELALADAGQLPLHMASVDVTELLSATVANFAIAAESQNVQIALRSDEALPPVAADVDRLAQVLRNFIVNALRYSPGGAVTVTATLLPAQGSERGRVCISVEDTGAGIAPEDLPHIFERFYRADKSRARSSGSSGLGLAIAKAWVEAMGGAIGVDSAAPKGSRFWFTLPVAKS